MSVAFLIMAAVTLSGAAGAMFLRQPVHCALSLVVAWAGLAVLFLRLGTQFVGFAQILVYVGAVAILVVFAILLTRNAEIVGRLAIVSTGWFSGLVIAATVFGCLAGAVGMSSVVARPETPMPQTTVKDLGALLMDRYVVPLEVIGLLLTAAMIGAVVIAMSESKSE
jgi:NADH-quinone oxidoreductase subunit J